MATEIFKIFSFSAAHYLPQLPESHPCSHMHGHTFHVEIHLCGPVNPQTGVVLMFEEIKNAWQPLHNILDHRTLNDIPGLEIPTSENLAHWIWQQLKPTLPLLSKIVIKETSTCGVTYTG
jgi:6-pyruvoyltetrahydropterin/6-carboxytetrahydropterin synthase